MSPLLASTTMAAYFDVGPGSTLDGTVRSVSVVEHAARKVRTKMIATGWNRDPNLRIATPKNTPRLKDDIDRQRNQNPRDPPQPSAGPGRVETLFRRFLPYQAATLRPEPLVAVIRRATLLPVTVAPVLGCVEIQVRPSRKWRFSRTGTQRTFGYVSTGSAEENRHLQAGIT